MSDDVENAESGMLEILTQPSRTLANWYFWVGSLGLFLAILNLADAIHPNYRVSWGGLLTFEYTNAAFGDKDSASSFVIGDAVFMLLCGGLVALGVRTLSNEQGVVEWIKSMLTNKWYNDLIEPETGGWSMIIGTWSMLGSVLFYFYWGITSTTWIDPGVYSWAIAMMAAGLVLRMLATVEEDSD
jgi:hypothetical protein